MDQRNSGGVLASTSTAAATSPGAPSRSTQLRLSGFVPRKGCCATRQPSSLGDSRPPFPRLRPGPGRLPPEAVERDQRRRITASAGRALADYGYAEMTVAHITAYASVSRATFYKNFRNKQDCLLGAHREIFERFLDRLSTTCRSQTDWTAKVSAAIAMSLAYMAEEPDEARMLTLDSQTADPLIARQVSAYQRRLADILRSGRRHLSSAPSPPQVTELAPGQRDLSGRLRAPARRRTRPTCGVDPPTRLPDLGPVCRAQRGRARRV
jgi:AcrR family transcriptional regulator